MADFRKMFLVLAVLAALAIPASGALPGPVVNCYTTSAPVIIRDGGLTELVGDVILQCDNTAQGAVNVTSNITIQVQNTDVTNRVQSGGSDNECNPNGIKCVTDAVLIAGWAGMPINQQFVGDLQSNLASGDVPNTRNAILFPNVFIPAGTITTIRITDVRVAAPAVNVTGIGPDVYERILMDNVTLTGGNTLQVATVEIPLKFSTSSLPTFQQCNAVNPSAPFSISFTAKFVEGFALAFKPAQSTTVPVGNVYEAESGYQPGPLLSPGGATVTSPGTADTGTNLQIIFTNIPAGVSIYVTQGQIAGTSPGDLPDGVVTNYGASGVAIIATNNDKASGSTGSGYSTVQVGSSGLSSWQVMELDPTYQNTPKQVVFGVVVSYSPNTTLDLPALSSTWGVQGELAPTSTVDYASSSGSDKIPRFRDQPQPVPAATLGINACASNLLFPYVTVKAGFDTGIALVNTSQDPFKTPTQHGACTMYYYDGTTTPPAPQSTSDIKAGGMVAFSMMALGGIPSSATVTNVPVPVGWQGYAIAHCNFQYAHGYAFISDRNIPGLGSQGYLALVLSTCGRNPDFADSGFVGCGEMLVE